MVDKIGRRGLLMKVGPVMVSTAVTLPLCGELTVTGRRTYLVFGLILLYAIPHIQEPG